MVNHDIEYHESTELYPGQEKVSCHTCTFSIIRKPWESSFIWSERKNEFVANHTGILPDKIVRQPAQLSLNLSREDKQDDNCTL